MSATNDGGPAFPELVSSHAYESREGGHSISHESCGGVSLRAYFAAKIMQGLLANPGGPIQACPRSGWSLCNISMPRLADEAVGMADELISALERKRA